MGGLVRLVLQVCSQLQARPQSLRQLIGPLAPMGLPVFLFDVLKIAVLAEVAKATTAAWEATLPAVGCKNFGVGASLTRPTHELSRNRLKFRDAAAPVEPEGKLP